MGWLAGMGIWRGLLATCPQGDDLASIWACSLSFPCCLRMMAVKVRLEPCQARETEAQGSSGLSIGAQLFQTKEF